MALTQIGRTGLIAIVLAVVGGLLTLGREIARYAADGGVDWGRVALAFGVPALIYSVVRSASAKQP